MPRIHNHIGQSVYRYGEEVLERYRHRMNFAKNMGLGEFNEICIEPGLVAKYDNEVIVLIDEQYMDTKLHVPAGRAVEDVAAETFAGVTGLSWRYDQLRGIVHVISSDGGMAVKDADDDEPVNAVGAQLGTMRTASMTSARAATGESRHPRADMPSVVPDFVTLAVSPPPPQPKSLMPASVSLAIFTEVPVLIQSKQRQSSHHDCKFVIKDAPPPVSTTAGAATPQPKPKPKPKVEYEWIE